MSPMTSVEPHGGAPVKVHIWPDHVWCHPEELEEMLTSRSDDFETVMVTEWDETGSPAARYFR